MSPLILLFLLINYVFSSNLFFQWRITDQENAQLREEAFSLFKSNFELYKKMMTNFETRDMKYNYLFSSSKNKESSDDETTLYLSRYTHCQKCMNLIKSLNQIKNKYGLNALYSNVKSVFCPLLKSKIAPKACEGLADNYGHIVFENIFSRYIDSYYLCEKIDLCPVENPKKIINVDDYADKILSDYIYKQKEKIQSGGKTLRMLQMTDIHLDLDYKVGSKGECDYPLCCRDMPETNEEISEEKLAGKYGYEGKCDINMDLLDSFVQDAYSRDVDLIIWTGDNPPHDSWQENSQDKVYEITQKIKDTVEAKFKNANNDIPIFYCLGNHEKYPNDNYRENEEDMLKKMANIYQDYLSPEAYESFKNYGYHSMKYKDTNLRIISLNCLLCDVFNFNLINSTKIHAKAMFEWLESELRDAEDKNDFVYIINHFPLNGGFTLTECSKRLHALFQRYQFNIRGIFSGHTHMDDLELISEYHNKDKIININYIAPQLTTFSGKLPSYRIYIIDEKTKQIIDFEQYRFNLDDSNKDKKPYWELAYKASEFYGVENMMDYQTLRVFNNIEDYVENRYSGSKNGKKNRSSAGSIKKARCVMSTNSFQEFLECSPPKGISEDLAYIVVNYLIGPFEE